jgi:hypothetical protein
VTTSGATPDEGSTSAQPDVLDPEQQTAAARHTAEID